MPKKKPGMTPEEQSEKFKALARELEAAGELNPTDAERRMDAALKSRAKTPSSS
jgi:hypothetical protein